VPFLVNEIFERLRQLEETPDENERQNSFATPKREKIMKTDVSMSVMNETTILQESEEEEEAGNNLLESKSESAQAI